jgi:deazaflavin-dependent oxidoreductase (nitroreductase family)
MRIGWAVHRGLFRLTGGRVGTQRAEGGRGTLFLVSKGRRTGAIRHNGMFYVEDGRRFVVVASNVGESVDPSWWLNLQANPDAEVEVDRRRIPVRAREATADESDELWPRLDAAYGEYAIYRAKATRPIPVVILEPR